MEKMVYTPEYGILLRMLRRLRQERGLTQVQLAERLSENQSFVSKCERGEHRLDVLELRIFCNGLGITLVEFITELEGELEKLEK